MNKAETIMVLSYIFADQEARIPDAKIAVWLDQFGHHQFQACWSAARLLAQRKIYGKVPDVFDFAQALREVLHPEINTDDWADAFEKWVTLARRFGFYRAEACLKAYEKACPLGYRALGTSSKEWWDIRTEQIATFRAQFRDRYRSLIEGQQRAIMRPLGLDGPTREVQQIMQSTIKLVELKRV